MPALRILAVILPVLLATPLEAETLLIDAVEQAPAGLERPRHGMTMDQVRERFGEPEKVLGPVGEPPITRWVYPEYTVYFENDLVLHTVINRKAAPAGQQ